MSAWQSIKEKMSSTWFESSTLQNHWWGWKNGIGPSNHKVDIWVWRESSSFLPKESFMQIQDHQIARYTEQEAVLPTQMDFCISCIDLRDAPWQVTDVSDDIDERCASWRSLFWVSLTSTPHWWRSGSRGAHVTGSLQTSTVWWDQETINTISTWVQIPGLLGESRHWEMR